MDSFSLLSKSKKILYLLLFAFFFLLLRVYQLSITQSAETISKKMPSQKKTLIQEAPRGQIFDRYNMPLAVNKIRYNADIYYSQIKEIPSFSWIRGKNQKRYLRKEYINKLSSLLASILNLDKERIEDLIHAKASLFPNTPFTIKENLSEKEYYQLKFLEKDYPGLSATLSLERDYPQKCIGSDLLGYMGAIGQNEYISIAQSIFTLEKYLEEEESNQTPQLPIGYFSKEHVVTALKKLKESSYTLSTMVGKGGLEKKFEKQLRGLFGKVSYEIDIFGHFIQKLPGEKEAISGRQIKLTLSSELQEHAENLLALSEKQREGTSKQYSLEKKEFYEQKQPWIKGGAIVALDPNNGEILALASYPRMNANDFIPSQNEKIAKQKFNNICKWLETPSYIRNLWDGKTSLSKEIYCEKEKKILQETTKVTWPFFLETILPKEGKIIESVKKIENIEKACYLQEAFAFISYFLGDPEPKYLIDALYPLEEGYEQITKETEKRANILENILLNYSNIFTYKKVLDTSLKNLPSNADKLFVLDLCRVCVYNSAFSNHLIKRIGRLSLERYRELSQAFFSMEDLYKNKLKLPFHEKVFMPWRKINEKTFLKEKRNLEKKRKTYARPYLDYLDEEEKKQFSQFWKERRGMFFLHMIDPEFTDKKIALFTSYLQSIETSQALVQMFKNLYLEKEEYLELFSTFRSFSELTRPLLSRYSKVSGTLEKDLARSFYPQERFSYGRSYAFCQAAPLGSIFKIITAYSALKVLHKKNPRNLEPFTFYDTVRFDPKVKKKGSLVVGYLDNRIPIPRFYKGGRMPKSHSSYIGEINLDKALEQSSNPYFSLLTTEILEDPEDLITAAMDFGLGTKTNIDLPSEYRGNLPNDLHQNKTGLYSFAIGQHTLLATPLQTALMLSAITNGGKLYKPQLIQSITGDERLKGLTKPLYLQNYAFKDLLSKVGIDYCLFTAKEHNQKESYLCESMPQLSKEIDLPLEVQQKICKGLELVVNGEKGTARGRNIRYLRQRPHLLNQYEEVKKTMLGKTSTAEITYNLNNNPSSRSELYKHIWFGAISYDEDKPELVVVVFLRFGDGGKEAAPYAAQIIHKYRELKRKHNH